MTAALPKTTFLMQFVCYFVLISSFYSSSSHMITTALIDETVIGSVQGEISQRQPQHTSGPTHFTVENGMFSTDNSNQHDISHLVLQPSILDFDELPIGGADSDVVTMFNKHTNRSVYLGSISGNAPDFYSSFFDEKVIPPMGNTTFNVVFLPRQQGTIETSLLIHTSFGIINYTLRGKGRECLFRLSPLVGLHAPYNATLTPEIYLYNPYNSPLQIIEVYSSGGQFQLELPTGGPEGPQELWEIPPFTTKPVIRVRFKATTPGNHTAYVRIKVSSDSNLELADVVLVVPIEVEIFPEHGVYSDTPFVNFGLGGTNDKPKQMVFKLLNSGQDAIDVQTYSVESSDITSDLSAAISLQIQKEENTGGVNSPSHLITATVDWSKIKATRYFKGHILIKALLPNNKITIHRIPFVGEILNGSIYYNESYTQFVTSAKASKTTKGFLLKNNFEVALAVTNITLPEDTGKYFKTTGFVPKMLLPGEEAHLFKLIQLATAAKEPTRKNILVHTNASIYEIPVSTYNGLLRRIVPVDENTINGVGVDEKAINYGTLSLSTVTDTVVAFVNDNPVSVTIHNWTATISDAASIYVILRGCGNLTMDNLKFCYSIQPKEWILFQVSVLSNAVGTFIGRLSLKTDYEELITPVRFSTAMGRLQFSDTTLDALSCFPGGLCSVNLTAYSTFSQPINVIKILVNVTGDTYEYTNKDFPAITPNELTHIGQLQFSPKSVCGDECYLAYPDRWAPAVISANCKNKEKDLMNAKVEAYRDMRDSFSAITFRVQTNQVRRYDFNGSAVLLWPKLIIEPYIEFPTFQVGEEVVRRISVNNPTDQTIQVYFMLHDVSQHGASMTYPPEVISMCWDCFLSRENVFSLIDMDDTKRSTFHYIPPKSNINLGVRFAAQNAGTYATLLYVRNNLTVLEAIWLRAKAAAHQFKFGNRKPGSSTPLMFELSDKHFRDCDRKGNMDSAPVMVTAKRTFTAKNTGDEPIDVYAMYIEGVRCEGYGFRVLDCWNFRLPPNSTKKIEIVFTPDFTLARVTRVLSIETSLSYAINYTMLSLVPAHALGTCGKALRRPEWEYQLQCVSFAVLLIAFMLVLLVAFFDSDKVLKDHVNNMSKDKGPMQPTLDLREVGGLRASTEDFSKQAIMENGGGENGLTTSSTSKTFAYLRKKPPIKKLDTDKKSWANVLARKFSPIKSDVKFRETTPPPLSASSRNTSDSKKETLTGSRRQLLKEMMDNIDGGGGGGGISAVKASEDDSCSNTTENSTQSSEISTSEKKQSSPGKKGINQQVQITPPTTTDHGSIKSKQKSSIKKTKSLPISNVSKDVEVIVPLVAAATGACLSAANTMAQKSTKVMTPKIVNGRDYRSHTANTEHNRRHFDVQSPASSSSSSSSSLHSALKDHGTVIGGYGGNNDYNMDKPNQKKYGKTPGRERRKHENPIGNNNNILNGGGTRKTTKLPPSTYKGTAFQFTSPLTNSPPPTSIVTTTSSPIWEINKLSFSNIVAQNPYVADPAVNSLDGTINNATTSTPKISSASSSSSSSICKPLSLLSQNRNGKMFSKALFQNFDDDNVLDINNDRSLKMLENSCEEMINEDLNNAVDLGPIGTRKSPSHTPVWEPLPSIQKPIATTNTNNSNSYFSGEFPQYSSNAYNNNNNNNGAANERNTQHQTSNIDLGGVSGLFDSVYGNHLTQKQRVWDPSTLINLLHHAQLQQQQQPQPQQQEEQSTSPPSTAATILQQQQQIQLNNHHLNQLLQQQQQQQPLQLIQQPQLHQTNMNLQNLYSNTSSLWGNNYTQKGWIQGPIRPPPGLEPLREQRPHHTQSIHLHHPLIQNNLVDQLNGSNNRRDDAGVELLQLPQYDPFSSLSAIWATDSWPKNPINSIAGSTASSISSITNTMTTTSTITTTTTAATTTTTTTIADAAAAADDTGLKMKTPENNNQKQ